MFPAMSLIAIVSMLLIAILTPTKRFINTTACTFTPTGGSAVTITGITSISFSPGAEETRAAGDGDLFDTLGVVTTMSPTVKISINEPNTMDAIAPGAIGTLVWTRNDARNGAATGGGARIYTITNAYFMPQADTSGHRQVTTGEYEFHTQSSDGTTNPAGVAAA